MMKKLYRFFALCTAVFCLTAMNAFADGGKQIYTFDDQFTSRDLKQEADLTDAAACVLSDGEDIHITEAGVYVLSGTAQNATVWIEAGEDDKVQIVLNGVNVENDDFPVIYAKSADKVFVTTSADSTLSVTGAFRTDGSVKTDGAIYAKCDLVLGGTANLAITSSENGVVGKDDVKITGGVLSIQAVKKAVEANDSIRIADGQLTLEAGTDGLHAENADDDTLGYVYIAGGSISIAAGDDGIHGTSVVQIDGGTLEIRAAEGIEGTCVQINDGVITIQSWDDGINAGQKSSAYRPTVEINGGELQVTVSNGDTDGIDSNGDIAVNGGMVIVNGSSTFDYDGSAQYTGGTIIVNGQQVSYIPNSMMGGRGGQGGQGWQQRDRGGFGRGGW